MSLYRTPIEAGHRAAVGGDWDVMGQHQLDFLRGRGLEPGHVFLDVGCGSLRAGVHLIPYLEPGNYYGIDQEQTLLDAGRTIELGEARFQQYRPTLVAMSDFGFERLGQTFDMAIAQSVFTHISLNLIMRCIYNLAPVMRSGGTFFATFFENEHGQRYTDSINRGHRVTHYDRDPFHYHPDTLRWVCEGTGLELEVIGEWGHPRGQRMLAFHKG